MRIAPLSQEFRLGLTLFLALTLAACGGGGGGGSSSSGGTAPPPPPPPPPPPVVTYTLSGSVTGLSAGTLVLAVAGSADVNVSANGTVALASGLASGAAYAVTVKTQPAGLTCQLTQASGTMPASNVTNVSATCAPTIALTIDAPADYTLVPLNTPQDITFTWVNTTPPRTSWSWTPEATSTLVAGGATGNTGQVRFQASAPGTYTITVRSLDDTSKSATIHLRVHEVYASIDALLQVRTYLRADGRAIGTTFSNVVDTFGAPGGTFTAVTQSLGARFGLRADGTVVGWGQRLDQAGNVAPTSPPAGLSHVVKVAAGMDYAAALKDDGTLVVWGRLAGAETQMPASLAATKFVAMDVGDLAFAGIRQDGSLVAWNGTSQGLFTLPSSWSGKTFTKLCLTGSHIVAVDSTGAVLTFNPVNSANPEMNTPPATTAPVIDVFCGRPHAALVQQDGRLRMWGSDLPVTIGAFDSNTVSGWPRVKGASLVDFQPPVFLTEGGALIDVAGNVVTEIDNL